MQPGIGEGGDAREILGLGRAEAAAQEGVQGCRAGGIAVVMLAGAQLGQGIGLVALELRERAASAEYPAPISEDSIRPIFFFRLLMRALLCRSSAGE
jgi:hypothetical protein